MTIRTINTQTGEETSRSLTQQELDLAVINTTAERAQQYIEQTKISFDNFESRFTSTEWDTATDFIYEIDTTTGLPKRRILVQGLARAQARNRINLLDVKTDTFLSLLVSGGIITASRKTEILTL